MESIDKLVDNIKLLIAGGDLSDSLRLRQLHRTCLQTFRELNANLERCRELAENGSLQAARELNCSFTPSLTQTAEALEFLRTDDFFSICKEYGLEMPVFPDERLLLLLNTPMSKNEQHLHVLLQEYRKIARSGTMQQRIKLLQQIVKKLPNSARWRNDLAVAERFRFQEIQHELASLKGNSDCCQKLEELYRELLSPEWLVPPDETLVEKLRQQLIPLQQARFNKETEERLQVLQDCYISRDIPQLETEFERWQIFCSSPLLNLSQAQKQTVEDVEKFLTSIAEERKIFQLAQELIKKIEQHLADDKPFSEITGLYNQLQLMDCEIPAALAERLEALEEEHRRCESLRSIRWNICCICGAAVLIAAIAASVFYVQHYRSVWRSSEELKKLFDKKEYATIIETFGKLEKTAPKIAKAPQVIAWQQKAKNELQRIENEKAVAGQNFSALLKQIERLAGRDALDNQELLDKCFKQGEEIHRKCPQNKKSWDKFSTLKTSIIQARTSAKEKRRRDFLVLSQQTLDAIQTLIREIPRKTPAELNVQLVMLRDKFNNKLADHYVDNQLKDKEKQRVAAKIKEYNEAAEKEKAFRLVCKPDDFEKYLEALDSIRHKYPDLALKYRNALMRKKEWQSEYKETRLHSQFPQRIFVDVPDISLYKGLFSEDLKKFMPKQELTDEFKSFFSNLQKMKEMKELIFTTSDNREFFFYISGPLRVENLLRPRRTNISFAAAASSEKSKQFVFSYYKNNPEPFKLISGNGKLPKSFALLNGKNEIAKDDKFFWPGTSLIGFDPSSTGPGANDYLQKALRFIHEEGNVRNVFLKEMFLNRFLKELYENAPQLYCEIDEKYKELRDYEQESLRDWKNPQNNTGYAEIKEELQKKWSRLDLERLLKAGELRGDFVCSFHARGLLPAGVVHVREDGKAEVHWFGKKIPPEGFILNLDQGKKAVVCIPDALLKGAVARDRQWKNLLFQGQVIWAFADGKSNREFIRPWKKRATELNIHLKIKPLILPADHSL